jgi:hypothetical protein
MRRMSLVLAFCALAAGCGGSGEYAAGDERAIMMDAAAVSPPASEPSASPAEVTAAAPMLAYRYWYGLEAPRDKVAGLLAGHESDCRAAGPSICQITDSRVLQNDDGLISGELTLRAEPQWLSEIRAGLAEDADAAGGRITRTVTETEDLTRSIVDTDARLRAQTRLRDRLENLLASRPGNLEELLELERELARVQGEIDSATSTLAVMRQRVQTSALTISYESRPTFAQQGAWSPVGDALRGAQGVVAMSIAAIIVFVAAIAPVAILVGGLAYVAVRLWKRRRKAKQAADSKPAAP